MHLIYLDESGNTGKKLDDPQQPVFALCGMIVDEIQWAHLETELQDAVNQHFPEQSKEEDFEVHAADLRNGEGYFKGVPVAARVEFRDAWMKIGGEHGIRLVLATVFKKHFATWSLRQFGAGIILDPHVAAFALVSRYANDYLLSLPDKPHGLFISDECKPVVRDIEKSLRLLRFEAGRLRLGQIIEKGFFIESHKSVVLQLCDLFVLSLRKNAERRWNLGNAKTVDDSGIELAKSLLYESKGSNPDVIDWMTKQYAKKK